MYFFSILIKRQREYAQRTQDVEHGAYFGRSNVQPFVKDIRAAERETESTTELVVDKR